MHRKGGGMTATRALAIWVVVLASTRGGHKLAAPQHPTRSISDGEWSSTGDLASMHSASFTRRTPRDDFRNSHLARTAVRSGGRKKSWMGIGGSAHGSRPDGRADLARSPWGEKPRTSKRSSRGILLKE